MNVFEGSQLKIQRRQREFFLLLLSRIPKNSTNSWENCKDPTKADCAKSSPTQSGPIPKSAESSPSYSGGERLRLMNSRAEQSKERLPMLIRHRRGKAGFRMLLDRARLGMS